MPLHEFKERIKPEWSITAVADLAQYVVELRPSALAYIRLRSDVLACRGGERDGLVADHQAALINFCHALRDVGINRGTLS